jgi:rod shape-determining protein MreD
VGGIEVAAGVSAFGIDATMHWIAFAILLYIVTTLQAAAVPFLAVHTIVPDLMVIVAVHYALAARSYDALLACWFIGLATDLSGISYQHHANVGVHALSMGIVALAVVKLRTFVLRDSVVTQLIATLAVKFTVAVLVGLHMMYAIND